MKGKVAIIAAILIIAGLVISASYAEPNRCGKGDPERAFTRGGPGHPGCPLGCGGMGPNIPVGKLLNNPEFIEKLGLTPEQITKLKKLHFEHQKKMINLHSNLELKRLEIRSLLDEDKLDKNLIRQKAKEIAASESDLALEKLEMMLAGGDVLTKEQIDKVKKMAHECMGKRVIKKKTNRPQRMTRHLCQPGGGFWFDEEDEVMILPPPGEGEGDEGEEIEGVEEVEVE
ncbi:MAG: Spy/CpxP family protein refolding chaperone [Acidobacteriota bacterium]